MVRLMASSRLSCPPTTLRPLRRVGVLVVREPRLRAGVQRVDGHLAVRRPGDLAPAVLDPGRRRGDAPRRVLADMPRLRQEVQRAAGREVRDPPLPGFEQLEPPVVQRPVQSDDQLQRAGGEHLLRAGCDVAGDHEAVWSIHVSSLGRVDATSPIPRCGNQILPSENTRRPTARGQRVLSRRRAPPRYRVRPRAAPALLDRRTRKTPAPPVRTQTAP